jgi:hypothetical protein
VDDLTRLANPRMPVGGQPRWLFESNYGRQTILYGYAYNDWTSGSNISLTPCDCVGVGTGESDVLVTTPTNWGTVDLSGGTVGGTAVTGLSCKIASGEVLQYAYAANGTPYLLGVPPTVVEFLRYDNSTYKLQLRVRWLFGTGVSTLSDWSDLVETEESKKVSCTTPGS